MYALFGEFSGGGNSGDLIKKPCDEDFIFGLIYF